jgi:hypothetical protein
MTPVGEMLSVRLDGEVLARMDALVASWELSRSDVVRRLVLTASPSSPVGGLARVELSGVTVRAESLAWIDARAAAWKWDRAQVVRQMLSEGRRVLELKAARGTPVGRAAPKLRVIQDEPVQVLDTAPADVVDAPVPS